MSNTVKGVYRNGQVQLLQKPTGIEDGDVEVTLSNVRGDRDDHDSSDGRRLRALRWLRESSWHLGGGPYPARDELHHRTR